MRRGRLATSLCALVAASAGGTTVGAGSVALSSPGAFDVPAGCSGAHWSRGEKYRPGSIVRQCPSW